MEQTVGTLRADRTVPEQLHCRGHSTVGLPPPTQADGIMSTTPDATLLEIIPQLNKVTGLPVIDTKGVVIGVISRADIIRVRKAGGLMADRVKKHMTAPALTIPVRATVQDAADLMMEKGIRRLPVVDADGRPLGLVSRSDIFRPLGDYQKAMAAEVAALEGAGSWQIKYLFDGSCPICSSMKALLERQDNGGGRMIFVDVSSDKYKPSKNMGISVDEAMTTIHAIRPDGSVLQVGTGARTHARMHAPAARRGGCMGLMHAAPSIARSPCNTNIHTPFACVLLWPPRSAALPHRARRPSAPCTRWLASAGCPSSWSCPLSRRSVGGVGLGAC